MLPHGVISINEVTLFAKSPNLACLSQMSPYSPKWGHMRGFLGSASAGLKHRKRGKVGTPGSPDYPVSPENPGLAFPGSSSQKDKGDI